MSDWTSCPCCDGDGGMTSGSYPDHEVRGGQYRATPAPLMSKGEADARIDLMKMTKQRDDLLEALAATPAPLALTPDLFSDLGEVLAAAVYETDGERYICRMCDSDVTTAPHSDDCEVKHLREWTFAANKVATPAPLDVTPEAAVMGTDARLWASEFVRLFGNDPDEGTMLGWFANAIEAGRAATPAPLRDTLANRLPEFAGSEPRDFATPAPLDLNAVRGAIGALHSAVESGERCSPLLHRVYEEGCAACAALATPAPLDDDGWQERGNPGEDATPAPLDDPVRGVLARAWKRKAKMYRGLWSRQLREFHDWRTALRAAGISEMVDMNPDAIRLTVTVPREKRINKMVEERIAAISAATPAPLDDLREALVGEHRKAVAEWSGNFGGHVGIRDGWVEYDDETEIEACNVCDLLAAAYAEEDGNAPSR